ncbi:DUF5984 family protein [Chitinophaga rhizophila]|uniref:SUKH-4 immunity protein of toxin-antitoxin system n=1 Tax=Chitinophaga rhizophila TaxID=2866212 RepID=A0ABS7GKN8_9BACT|nr:DUF5984 family protein [Chitinophaga rhizophila]MBW8687750.1 hypothetical protein [Chitinophaga rhizophila]
MALINFKLKHPDNIIPWGDDTETTMHWFGLTDGEYWLDINKATLYEYTDEILAGGDPDDSRYVAYQVVRLIEDWTSIFESIAEPIPEGFYAISRNCNYLYRFYGAVQQWLEKLSEDPAIDMDAYYEKYDKTIEWVYSRTLVATHLTGGPSISFFRNGDNISIVWRADHQTANDIPVWTAQNGEVEISYNQFVSEMEDFGKRFFNAMATQIQLAIAKDWGATNINKERLMQEQQERKAAFEKNLEILKGTPTKHTDWDAINVLITEMFS